MFVWIYVAESSSSCSPENQLSGLSWAACAGVVTTCVCLSAYFVSDKPDTPGNAQRSRIILACAAVSLAGYTLRMWGFFLGPGSTVCMYPGRCGHLTRRPEGGMPFAIKVNAALTYLLPLLVLLLTARGADGRKLNWSVCGPGFIGIGSLVVICVDFWLLRKCSKGEELTIWCWFCSCLCLWSWFEVRLYNWFVDPGWAPTTESGKHGRVRPSARAVSAHYKGL